MKGIQGLGITLIRVTLGVIYVMHAYLALIVVGPAGMAGYTARLGYPAEAGLLLAWYLILAHGIGGLLLVVGLWARWAALAQVPIMASAVFLHHWRQGFFMTGIIVDAAAGRAIAGGVEYTLLVLATSVAVALLGPGPLAVRGVR